jgi:hypothetical protein
MSRASVRSALAVASLACVLALALAPSASGEELADEGGAAWRLEQPSPPAPPPGVVGGSSIPIGLGGVGDVEFWAPNRGLLITAGNSPTIAPGLWAYNGQRWHQLSTVCGATDGRIAWAGSGEFWTVSDGRPGQANGPLGESPPLADNTLCHFANGQVVKSYAHPAFEADSYRPMHAAGCIAASDCWFAGDAFPEPLQAGAFHLHWTGASPLAEPYLQAGHAVQDMSELEGRLYESVRIAPDDRHLVPDPESLRAFPLHNINPGPTADFEAEGAAPLYEAGEFPSALDFLHLSVADGQLWGAAGSVRETPAGSQPGQLTVVRFSPEGGWTQLLGPEHPVPTGLFAQEAELLPEGFKGAAVTAIAAEPGTGAAWIAVDSQAGAAGLGSGHIAHALLARVAADGNISDVQVLPSPAEEAEGIGPKGAGAKLACPAPRDCWMTTASGWLYHLAPEGERSLPQDTDPAFAGLITFRPTDEGLPQVAPDAPPADDSGLLGEVPSLGAALAEASVPPIESRVVVPLLSHLRSKLVRGTTLQVSFHLAVKARVRLLATRRKRVVAATPTRTLAAGNRALLLRLNRRRWPTKLDLQTHALQKLPTVSSTSSTVGTVSTGFASLPKTPLLARTDFLP